MATSQNLTQITNIQTGSANSTSLLYAVTNGSLDTQLPLSVLVNNLGLTGVPTTPTAAVNTNTVQIASCSFVMNQAALYAPLAGATFTGNINVSGSANTVTLAGAVTGVKPAIQASGTDTNVGLNVLAQGSTTIGFGNVNGNWFATTGPTSSANYLRVDAVVASSSPTLEAVGTDTNININLTPKGSGKIIIPATTISGGTIDATTIGATTAAAGKFTTLQATGAIAPSTTSGLVGTTLADNANVGSIGEYITSAIISGISLTSGTPANITSISLTAGDWDVSGLVGISGAGSTTFSQTIGGSSSTSATLGSVGTYWQHAFALPAGSGDVNTIPTVRYNVSTTTTVYLIALSSFAVSTATAFGIIHARRVR